MRFLVHLAAGLLVGSALGCTNSSEVGGFDGIPVPDDEGSGGHGGEAPVGVPLEPVQARLALGVASSCALDSSGAAVCWGNNLAGQLGIGNYEVESSWTPEHVIGLGSGVQGLFGGTVAHCAVTTDGHVECWGDSIFGSFNGEPVTHYPILEPFEAPGLGSVVQMALGTYFHCALNVEGRAKCYGLNSVGQVGNGSTADSLVPTDVVGLDPCRTITASQSGFFACAASLAGKASCWGYNDHGQLGDGSHTDAVQAVAVQGLESGVTAMTAGRDHACAVVGGGVKCWGSNAEGQLGSAPGPDQPAPVDVPGMPAIAALAAGAAHTCALSDVGGVHCWGTGYDPALELLSGAVEIAAGGGHTCARLADGRLRCWGASESGQLGPFDGEGAPL